LDEIVDTRKSRIPFGKDKVITAQSLLNEALECAVGVHQFVQQQQQHQEYQAEQQEEEILMLVAKDYNGGHEKVLKTWTDLDRNFETKLKKICVFHELVLNAECIELSQSSRFKQMISILTENKLPIEMDSVDLDERGSFVDNISFKIERLLIELDHEHYYNDHDENRHLQYLTDSQQVSSLNLNFSIGVYCHL
jgi:hypothetical protein